ncbi:MAG: hypothetical protein LBB48_07730 [Treponema sp.]|jgi:hypothetical protein|nr:hypothetical protein [Treponema sp.]
MVTIILTVALLVALAGLCVEIGVASWNIIRANRYWRKGSAAEYAAKRASGKRRDMGKRMEFLDDYVSKILWLLSFLYKRYARFSDLEDEIETGLRDLSGDTSVMEADAGYKNLERALEIIKAAVPEWKSDRKNVSGENETNAPSRFDTGADEIPAPDAETLNS